MSDDAADSRHFGCGHILPELLWSHQRVWLETIPPVLDLVGIGLADLTNLLEGVGEPRLAARSRALSDRWEHVFLSPEHFACEAVYQALYNAQDSDPQWTVLEFFAEVGALACCLAGHSEAVSPERELRALVANAVEGLLQSRMTVRRAEVFQAVWEQVPHSYAVSGSKAQALAEIVKAALARADQLLGTLPDEFSRSALAQPFPGAPFDWDAYAQQILRWSPVWSELAELCDEVVEAGLRASGVKRNMFALGLHAGLIYYDHTRLLLPQQLARRPEVLGRSIFTGLPYRMTKYDGARLSELIKFGAKQIGLDLLGQDPTAGRRDEILSNVVDGGLGASFGFCIHAASCTSMPSWNRTLRMTLAISS